MNIGILYIALGEYTKFFDGFYRSCEQHFLSSFEKRYYVFTDDVLKFHGYTRVETIATSDEGWPYNTLFRYRWFYSIKDRLQNHDFVFFFNANTFFIEDILETEIIPYNEGIVALSWTNVYKNSSHFPYERNKCSKAYIPKGLGRYYYQGGLNGGKSACFIDLIDYCYGNIEDDLRNGCIAKFHDESHLNKYLLDKDVLLLGAEYGCPEERDFADNPKIIFRDKNKLLGKSFMNKLKGTEKLYCYKNIMTKILKLNRLFI